MTKSIFCHILSVCFAGLFANQAIAALQIWFGGRGIRFGIIIGGNPDFDDDISWTKEGLRVLRDLYTNPAIFPGYMIVQSWQANPTHMLLAMLSEVAMLIARSDEKSVLTQVGQKAVEQYLSNLFGRKPHAPW